MSMAALKDEPTRRGRPPTGRKTIIQVAVDDDVLEYLEKVAIRMDGSISAAGRAMIEEGIKAASKKGR